MTKPEYWVVVKVVNPNATDPFLRTIHKVFASWDGDNSNGEEWRMNSGINRTAEEDSTVKFYGYSDSLYECNKNAYGTASNYTNGVLNSIISKARKFGVTITILPEETDWLNL